MTPARIAFVAPLAWHAISGEPGYVGGAEMQQARLARVLAARGHDVWMIVADFGQAARVTIDGVEVERSYAPHAGIPGLRFFHPRWSGIAAALDRVQPDIVYQRTAGVLTGQCALWARARGRRFVFASAHDFDSLPQNPFLGNPRDRFLYGWGLRHADVVIAQSEAQADAFRRNHGIIAPVVRNVIEVPAVPRAEEGADRVLWLGTVKADKRPGWVLDAARAIPSVRFTLAGGPPPPPMSGEEDLRIARLAAEIPNVDLAGRVAPDEVPRLLARAALFAHTSPAEGFPNTLLEAWACGIPSVSVVDPDGAVSGAGTGLLVRDRDEFIEAIGDLMYDSGRRRVLGAAARRYTLARHAPDAVAHVLEGVLGLATPTSATQTT
jgi:glycosyltransferase involved in cell wall biosynthesis